MKLTILLFLLLLPSTAFAVVGHQFTVSGEDAILNTTILLESQNPVDVWNLNWSVSGNLMYLGDETGQINDYTIDGDKINFRTNKDSDRNREIVNIVYLIRNAYDDKYYPVRFLDLSFPGFENDTTTISIIANDIISSSVPFRFNIEAKYDRLLLEGRGPIGIILYTGSGRAKGNYIEFGNSVSISEANINYALVSGTLGFIPFYTQFPLLILGEKEYNFTADSFSAGTQRTGGIIILRDSEDDITSTLLHETVHAYNGQIMNWKKSKGAWFDEGTAQYVEWLAKIKSGERYPQLFGKNITYRKGSFIYTITPSGDAEQLWNYYMNNYNFIESWAPKEAENRDFGYALSELIIRKHIMGNGPRSLHDIYEKLININKEINTDAEFSGLMKGFGIDMRPCYSFSRTEFDACLNDVNNYNPTMLTYSGEITNKKSNAEIKSFEEIYGTVENYKPEEKLDTNIARQKNFLESITDAISGFINAIADFFASLFRH